FGNASETAGGDRQSAEWVALERIETKRHNNRIRREGFDAAQRRGERRKKFGIAGFSRQRQIEIVAKARTFAAFVGMAPEKWIETHRIGMDRDSQHIRTGIENALRAIAMMQIDVEDRHTPDFRAQAFCRDRRIVDEAEAARHI